MVDIGTTHFVCLSPLYTLWSERAGSLLNEAVSSSAALHGVNRFPSDAFVHAIHDFFFSSLSLSHGNSEIIGLNGCFFGMYVFLSILTVGGLIDMEENLCFSCICA